jgi:hypothetical protein
MTPPRYDDSDIVAACERAEARDAAAGRPVRLDDPVIAARVAAIVAPVLGVPRPRRRRAPKRAAS